MSSRVDSLFSAMPLGSGQVHSFDDLERERDIDAHAQRKCLWVVFDLDQLGRLLAADTVDAFAVRYKSARICGSGIAKDVPLLLGDIDVIHNFVCLCELSVPNYISRDG